MKPEAPHLRRFFFAGKRVVMVADDLPAAPDLPLSLPAAGVLYFATGEIRHTVCIKIKKERKKSHETKKRKRKNDYCF